MNNLILTSVFKNKIQPKSPQQDSHKTHKITHQEISKKKKKLNLKTSFKNALYSKSHIHILCNYMPTSSVLNTNLLSFRLFKISKKKVYIFIHLLSFLFTFFFQIFQNFISIFVFNPLFFFNFFKYLILYFFSYSKFPFQLSKIVFFFFVSFINVKYIMQILS